MARACDVFLGVLVHARDSTLSTCRILFTQSNPPWHFTAGHDITAPGNIEAMPMSRWQLQDGYIRHLTFPSSGLPVAILTANCNLASNRNVSSVSFNCSRLCQVSVIQLYILNAGHKAFLYLSCDLLCGSRGMTWLKRFNLKCCSHL